MKMKVHRSMKIEEELEKKIKAMAEKEQRSVNNMIEVLLNKAVKK
jgi:hypothetical protein